MSRHAGKSRVLDFVAYVAIGIGLLAVGLIYAEYSFRSGRRPQLPLRWIGLAGETAVLFGYVGRAMRSYWKNRRFWAGFLGFLAAHLIVYVIVLLRVERFPLLWFVFIGYLEWIALAYLLDLLLREPGQTHSRSWHDTV